MPTVIDSLLVELGLDPTDYLREQENVRRETEKQQKEIEKSNAAQVKASEKARNDAQRKQDAVNRRNDKERRDREREQKRDEADRKKHIDETTDSIGRMGMTLAGAVLGFEGLKGGFQYLGQLNSSQAALGYTAKRIGVSAEALNVYGKAVEYAGGKAEDATATFAQLSKEFTQFNITGKPGPLLQLLTQKGVAFRDAQNRLLDIGSVLDDLGRKTQNMNDADRANLFAQAGISEGVINRLLESTKLQDEQLQRARDFNNASALSVETAQKLQDAWRGVGQSVGKASEGVLQLASGPLTKLGNYIADYIGGRDTTQSGSELFGGRTPEERGAAAREKYQIYALEHGLRAPASGGPLAPKPGTAASRNNNPGNLEDAQGRLRVFTTLAEGQAAQRADIEAKMRKGFNTISSIITRYEGKDGLKDPYALAAYITRAEKLVGKDRNATLTEADIPKLIDAMTAVESGLPDSAVNRGPAVGATPGAQVARNNAPAASGNVPGNSVSVQVDQITVNSPNADPTAVANQTAGALQRKLSVAQANVGQT